MAGAVLVNAADGGGLYPGKLTGFVLLTCLVAATGGLIFGYGIGISGGVTSMDSFLKEFFPSVYRKEAAAAAESTSKYCQFDSQLVTAFTSSLYLAALVASLVASTITRVYGRKCSMLLGGMTCLSGAVINGAARNVAMLMAGRILLGVGVGFVKQFFPSVYRKEEAAAAESTSKYCQFDSQLVTAFTSSLYLAALVASLVASTITRVCGSKCSMTSLSGAVINGAARNVAMLMAGRILLGVGVGFVRQSAPLYLSEMAPARYRGMLNIGFQVMLTVGIFLANLVNYGAAKIEGGWGWRVSLAGAAVPAAIITLGSIFLPDTPNSLIDRGKAEQAREILRKIRGTDAVGVEFQDLVVASNQSRQVKHPWKSIVQRRYRPQLTMALLIPSFHELTGIGAIGFYGPVLLKTIGFSENSALMSPVITGLVNFFATFVSIYYADHAGRRSLFLEGGIHMFICQMLMGTLIWKELGVSGEGNFGKGTAVVVVLLICVYVAGFSWSWGPLGTLVPSEVLPLEVRSAGQSVATSMGMLFKFGIAQAFLALLCRLKFGIFYFFAGWLVLMTVFVYLFLPETKNVPLEEMARVWGTHWFWCRFVPHCDVVLEKEEGYA